MLRKKWKLTPQEAEESYQINQPKLTSVIIYWTDAKLLSQLDDNKMS